MRHKLISSFFNHFFWRYPVVFLSASWFLIGLSLLIPHPYSLGAALPAPQGYVSDFANILTDEQQGQLEASLVALEQQTGNEVAVVTVASLEGNTIEGYAVELFEEWKIGQVERDNGALLLVAPVEREVRIEVGYGLEPLLTDAVSYWIIQDKILPAFRQSDYFGGISAGVEAIGQTLTGGVVPEMTTSAAGQVSDYFGLLVVFLMFLVSLITRSKSWWLGGVVGGVLGLVLWWFYTLALFWIIPLALLGLGFDYLTSRAYARSKASGTKPPWWAGGGGFGHHGGGGFGGFGGGSSGGGGASGRW